MNLKIYLSQKDAKSAGRKTKLQALLEKQKDLLRHIKAIMPKKIIPQL
jgi:hypothetical protein